MKSIHIWQKTLFYLTVISFGVSSLNAKTTITSQTVPTTRKGVTYSMVAYNFWSGEYPKPVIYVKKTDDSWRKIEGYASLRKLTERKICSIRPGIYHPWSKDKTSLIDFYTLTPKIDYVAKSNATLDEQQIQRGDRLENEFYIAEGSCSYLLNKRRQITTTCIKEAVEDPSIFSRTKKRSHPREQWLYLNCKEGYNVFVKDTDLLKQPNVKKGKIIEYGKVAAPTDTSTKKSSNINAIENYKKLCANGDINACVEIANEYINGEYTKKHYEVAKGLLELACENKNPKGCTKLGVLYAKGLGVKQNIKKAKIFFKKGCDLGDKKGCKYLTKEFKTKVDNPQKSNTQYNQYANGRFGFTLTYPSNLFVIKKLSDNGDGVILLNRDKSLELRAYGSWYGSNIKKIYRDNLGWAKNAGERVTYKVLKKNWFVLSGVNKEKQTIFYQKSYFKGGKSVSFRLKYPIRDKAKYDSLVSFISKNFKPY